MTASERYGARFTPEGGGFERALAPYRERLRVYLGRTLSNPEDVRDAEAETIARAVAGFETFKGRSSFGTWLFSISRNVLREKYRRDARARDLFKKLESVGETAPFELTPEELLLTGDTGRKRAVLGALGALTQAQRRIVSLILLSGFSAEDAARELELTPDAARMLLARSVRSLRTELIKRGEIDG